MAEHLTENVKLRLDSDLLRRLERFAAKGDRTTAAEMRRGLRFHVERLEAEEATGTHMRSASNV